MDTSPFSFCDSFGFYVRSDIDKSRVTRDLAESYGVHIMHKQYERYKGHMAPMLKRAGRYVAMLRHTGSVDHMLFLTRVDFAGVCIVIEKRLRGDAFHPRMMLVRLTFADALFDDTVLDGELAQRGDGRWVFHVSDVLVHSGRRVAGNILQRVEVASRIVQSAFLPDDHDPFVVTMKHHFHVQELRDVVSRPHPYGAIHGVCFKPVTTGGLAIMYSLPRKDAPSTSRDEHNITSDKDDTDDDADANITYDDKDAANDAVKEDVIAKTELFYTRRTSMPDVYELWSNKDDVGTCAPDHIAGVPSMATSAGMLSAFADVQSTAVLAIRRLEYVFNQRINKWVLCNS